MKVRLSLDKKEYKLEFYARKGNNTTTIELKLASGIFIDHILEAGVSRVPTT